MAVTFDVRFEDARSAGASPFSFTSNNTSDHTYEGSVGSNTGRVLIVVVGFSTDVPTIGTVAVTWAGNGMTQITQVSTVGASPYSTFIFGLKTDALVTTGAQVLAVSWTGAAFAVSVGAISLYNCDTTTGWQNQTSQTGNGTSASITVTSANGNLIVAGLADEDANGTGYSVTAGTGRWNERRFTGNYGCVTNPSSGASTAATVTIGNVAEDWGMVGVDVIAFSAGGGDLSVGVGAIGEPVVGGSSF